ncbi:MAG TPA: glycosyltransferase family 2 protein [Thermoleophilaceae bacterium]|jgi:GT2 family glycosyltransferase
MEAAPALSVVIATRDRVGRLRKLLDSLRDQSFDGFEVIVVDDGSLRGTPELMRRYRDGEAEAPGLGLRDVRREEAGGPSAARNDGWPLARAPLVAFTDDDCVATPGWVAALLAAAERAPGAVVQGRTLPDPREESKLGPRARSLWVEEPGPYYQAANILYPRSLLERLEGFDAEAFPCVGEDTDLAWRAIAAGAAVEWAPDALVHHAVRDLGTLGALRMAARWTPSIRLFARHRALRAEHLTHGVFWKGSHYLLARFLLALVLRRRARWLALWLGAPYVRNLIERVGGPRAAPFHLVHDLVEAAAVVRGAVRYRTPVI